MEKAILVILIILLISVITFFITWLVLFFKKQNLKNPSIDEKLVEKEMQKIKILLLDEVKSQFEKFENSTLDNFNIATEKIKTELDENQPNSLKSTMTQKINDLNNQLWITQNETLNKISLEKTEELKNIREENNKSLNTLKEEVIKQIDLIKGTLDDELSKKISSKNWDFLWTSNNNCPKTHREC